MTHVQTTIAGEDVRLLPERALFWPRRKTLFIADIHIGKAAAFRAAGSPVPVGSTTYDLQRLSRCISATSATRLVVLGDFYHARAGQAPATMEAVRSWRALHPDLHVEIIRGNHDRRSDPSPSVLQFTELNEGALDLPFVLAHHPVPSPNGHVLAGHIHPGAHLRGGPERMKLPCFHIGRHVTVLPAFGSFTGLAAIETTAGDEVYVVADDEIIRVSV